MPVSSAVLTALNKLSSERLMQCKRRAEYRGISMFEQMELQLYYESPEQTPDSESSTARNGGWSPPNHRDVTSSPKKRKRNDEEHNRVPDRGTPQHGRANAATPASCHDSFGKQPGHNSISGDMAIAQPSGSRPAVRTTELASSGTWPQCCTREAPCPSTWKAQQFTAKKYYAVRRGRKLGIYYDWKATQAQVDKFSDAAFKGFAKASDAEGFMNSPTVAGCFEARQPPVFAIASVPGAQTTSKQPEKPEARCIGCRVPFIARDNAAICPSCAAETLERVSADFRLCQEQRQVLDYLAEGNNVFFTGAAGAGKSTVLKAAITYLRAIMKQTQVVAPTGIAALLLGGTTIHAYAGWRPRNDKELSLEEIAHAAGGKKIWKRLKKETDVLIIDEISMVENFTFGRLDHLMQAARSSDKPFGGVQVIVTGDFYQLSPVKPLRFCFDCGEALEVTIASSGETRMYTCEAHRTWDQIDMWAFRSDAWKACNFRCIELAQIHRQSDSVFISLLNKLRAGMPLSNHEDDMLRNHTIDFDPEDAVKIHPLRATVDMVNGTKLSQLPAPEQVYRFVDSFQWRKQDHPDLLPRFRRAVDGDETSPFLEYGQDRHRYAELLAIKKGMPVILLQNLDFGAGLVNGSRGHVIGFEDIDLQDLPPMNGDHKRYQEEEVRKFAEKQSEWLKGWPIVEFENNVTRTIYAHCTMTELGPVKPHSLMSRTQLPLIAGWAITIHKSQGMTIEKAVVDVSSAWEHAQSYVAMSRVKTLSGLLVRGLPHDRAMKADPTVADFMRSFTS